MFNDTSENENFNTLSQIAQLHFQNDDFDESSICQYAKNFENSYEIRFYSNVEQIYKLA